MKRYLVVGILVTTLSVTVSGCGFAQAASMEKGFDMGKGLYACLDQSMWLEQHEADAEDTMLPKERLEPAGEMVLQPDQNSQHGKKDAGNSDAGGSTANGGTGSRPQNASAGGGTSGNGTAGNTGNGVDSNTGNSGGGTGNAGSSAGHPSSSQDGTGNSSKPEGGAASTGPSVPEAPAKPEHTHNWVEQTQVIQHEATGHYEPKVVQEAVWKDVCVCLGCGYESATSEEAGLHCLECESGLGYTVKSTKIQDEVKEQVWVEDTKAWEESVVTGYVCDGCGAVK